MLRAYKTELNPSPEQCLKIKQTIGVCRFVYNLFLSTNKDRYAQGLPYMSGYDFSKWLNNEFIPNNQGFHWIKDVSSKSVKYSIMQADKAYKNFFKQKKGFPRFKRKHKDNPAMYLPKNNATDLIAERHRVKLPTLGWVRLKEFGYIPTNAVIRSAYVSYNAGRYYVSVLIDEPVTPISPNPFGLVDHILYS